VGTVDPDWRFTNFGESDEAKIAECPFLQCGQQVIQFDRLG
jgi:hypothetical protein